MAIAKVILNGETLMDVTSDTATANNMLSGIQATKNDGTKVTGNIASKSSSDLTASGATVTAPAGYYANAASKAVATTTHPSPTATITSSTGVVTATHAQTTGYVAAGTTTGTLNLTTQAGKTVTPTEAAQTAVASYRWTTGPVSVAAISSTYVGTGVAKKSAADLTVNGSTVTAPIGYYSSAVSKAVAAGSAFPPAVTITKAPTIGVNTSGVVTASYNGSSSITPTVTSGYISQGTAGTISTTGTSTYQLTSKAAATYYPSTVDQTIASQRWLVGNQTIKSVTTSNLTAENIAEGVVVKVGDSGNASRITQVTGTHSGTSTYTATILNNHIGSSNVYFTYNGIKSTELGSSFTFHAGDTVVFTCSSGHSPYIQENNKTIASTSPYTYTLPAYDIGIEVWGQSGGSSTYAYLRITLSQMDITENGKYNVCDYGYVSVSVPFTADQIATRSISGIISGSANKISAYAFCSCTQLTEASFFNCLSIGLEAFAHATNLSSIYFPNCQSISTRAFYGTHITEASFSSCTTILSSAFGFCQLLSTISFPVCTYIGNYAFYYGTSLSMVFFPSCKTIGEYAFANCTTLTTASFPAVLSISGVAFSGCTSLSSLYLLGSSVPRLYSTNAFDGTPISDASGKIYVPTSLYNSYLASTNWSDYSLHIVSV